MQLRHSTRVAIGDPDIAISREQSAWSLADGVSADYGATRVEFHHVIAEIIRDPEERAVEYDRDGTVAHGVGANRRSVTRAQLRHGVAELVSYEHTRAVSSDPLRSKTDAEPSRRGHRLRL